MAKWLYEIMYRIPFIPISWIFGAAHEQQEYVQLFENGSILDYQSAIFQHC
jgi:hypothetical protein